MFLLIALGFLVSRSNSLNFVEVQPGRLEFSQQGDNVTLSCSPNPTEHPFPSMLTEVDCRGAAIYWRKYDRGGNATDISYCLNNNINDDRFTVDYSGNTYNLHISNVQPSDAGQYHCKTYYSSEEALTVQLNVGLLDMLKDKPSCSANPQTIEVGDNVSLVCSLQIFRALQWVGPNGTVVSLRSSESNPEQPLVLNFTAMEEHNFQTFTCEDISESGTYMYNPSCSVTPLKYTFITISPHISHVKQGDNVVFNCDARLGPPRPARYHYIWLRDDNIVLQGQNMSSYSFHDIRLHDNGARVRCKASLNGREEMESSEAVIYVNSATEDREELTIYVLIGGAILLVTSFSVNIALVVCLVKSKKARNKAETLPTTGGLQMTHIDLQQQDVTNAEYVNCRVESDTYVNEAVGLDVEYEVPTTDTMDYPVDNGLVYDYALPNV